jgi:hypothetical protein
VLYVNSFVLAKDNSSGGPSMGAVVLDILVHRPLGLCGTILGASAYAISLPVTVHFIYCVMRRGLLKRLVRNKLNHSFYEGILPEKEAQNRKLYDFHSSGNQ